MCIAWLWQWIWESKTTTCKCNRLYVRNGNVELHMRWSHFAPFMYLFCSCHFICLFVGWFDSGSSFSTSLFISALYVGAKLNTSNRMLKMHKPVRSTVDFPIQMVYTLNFTLTFLAPRKAFCYLLCIWKSCTLLVLISRRFSFILCYEWEAQSNANSKTPQSKWHLGLMPAIHDFDLLHSNCTHESIMIRRRRKRNIEFLSFD